MATIRIEITGGEMELVSTEFYDVSPGKWGYLPEHVERMIIQALRKTVSLDKNATVVIKLEGPK